MSDLPLTHPFKFITPKRAKIFRTAISSANDLMQTFLSQKNHVFEHIPNLERAFTVRGGLVGHIAEAFTSEEGSVQYNLGNMWCVAFDNEYLVRIVKIENPENPPAESRLIKKLRNRAHQLRLEFPDDETEDGASSGTPLHSLYFITVGYITNRTGLITALYFIDQNGTTVNDQYQLDLVTSKADQQHAVDLPKTTFSLKSNVIKKDQAK